MDWQMSEETVPSAFVTEAHSRSLGAPPVTGAWRDGDHPGNRRFAFVGDVALESGSVLPRVRMAYETWGTLNADASNALLLVHSLTADSHAVGVAGPGHVTDGWWNPIVGPGLAIDTDKWFVVCPNTLGGCQGSTGPSSVTTDGREWGSRFPYLTIRDQTTALKQLADSLGIDQWGAVVGGSAAGMSALEYAVTYPDKVERLALLATTAITSADQISLNCGFSAQTTLSVSVILAIRSLRTMASCCSVLRCPAWAASMRASRSLGFSMGWATDQVWPLCPADTVGSEPCQGPRPHSGRQTRPPPRPRPRAPPPRRSAGRRSRSLLPRWC